MVSFLIDGVLAVMLVTATVFLVIVNKRLKVLRSAQAEIGGLIATFSKTIDDTEASVNRLVAAATEASSRLADELDRSKGVTEEVTLILGSCERASKRIEESVQQARALVRRLEETPRPRPVPPAAAPLPVAAPVAVPVAAPAAPAAVTGEAAGETAGAEPADLAAVLPVLTEAAEPATPAAASATDAGEEGDVRAPVQGAAPPGVEKGRTMAASAFYARLRTVGTGN